MNRWWKVGLPFLPIPQSLWSSPQRQAHQHCCDLFPRWWKHIRTCVPRDYYANSTKPSTCPHLSRNTLSWDDCPPRQVPISLLSQTPAEGPRGGPLHLLQLTRVTTAGTNVLHLWGGVCLSIRGTAFHPGRSSFIQPAHYWKSFRWFPIICVTNGAVMNITVPKSLWVNSHKEILGQIYLNFKFSSILSIFPPKKLCQPTCLPTVSECLFPYSLA